MNVNNIVIYNVRRLLLLLLVALTAITLFCSCNEKRRVVIGVSQCSEDVWRERLNDELMLASYQHPEVDLKIVSAHDDDQLQVKQIEQLVSEGVDLLIISPNQERTISPIINKVYGRGIPVILFDRQAAGANFTAFIGADNVEAGRVMGEYIAQQLGGKGIVAEITGLQGSSPARDRHEGFLHAMNNYPGISIVGNATGAWLKAGGEKAMDSLMADGQHIDFVFAQNDRMALGARQHAQAKGHNDIGFVGIDALNIDGGGMDKVADGTLSASYLYPTRGDLVMQLAMNILEGKPYEKENYLTGAIITKGNAQLLMMQADEMENQRDRLHRLHGEVDEYLTQFSHQKVYLALSIAIIALLIALVVFVYYSITAKHRLAAEANQGKLRFFTNISHELRTPLTLISDPLTHLAQAENLTPSQRGTLDIANRNVQILTRLVNQILDFRKVQNNKMEMRTTTFLLADQLTTYASLFAEAIAKKKITLTTQWPEDLWVTADRSKLESMCYNLLSNALKYTPQGGNICFTAKEANGQVSIAVENTGKGIRQDELPRLFDRFYQSKGSEGGSGIGLALVKAFCELHGGTASASSTDGKTATFTLSLPIKADESEKIKAKSEAVVVEGNVQAAEEDSKREAFNAQQQGVTERLTANEEPEEKPRLLVIDDNADIRDYLHMIASPLYDVTLASDGAEGLRYARKELPDVIVCDVMMPVMDGLEFCRQLKADPIICHIPVLLLTARSMAEHQAEGYSLGADAYLTKPFSKEVLLARLANLISNRRLIKNIFAQAEPAAEAKQERPATADEEFISRFRKVIEANLGDSNCNADKLASEMGFSRTQLYRKVKAITGHSANDILREARLQRADHLLKTTHKTAAEIAYEVGFSSPSYFSKMYKEAFGRTPLEQQ